MSEQYGKGGRKDDCFDWYASHDHMPPGPKTLHVTGKCKFPTEGYSVELRPADPQGINPKIYILEKIIHAPTGSVVQVETVVDVQYDEKTDQEYEQVEIRPDNTIIDVVHTE
jgi:hypothetical protein